MCVNGCVRSRCVSDASGADSRSICSGLQCLLELPAASSTTDSATSKKPVVQTRSNFTEVIREGGREGEGGAILKTPNILSVCSRAELTILCFKITHRASVSVMRPGCNSSWSLKGGLTEFRGALWTHDIISQKREEKKNTPGIQDSLLVSPMQIIPGKANFTLATYDYSSRPLRR